MSVKLIRRFENKVSSSRTLEDRLEKCSIDISRVLAMAEPQKLSKIDTSQMRSAYLAKDNAFLKLLSYLKQWNIQVEEYTLHHRFIQNQNALNALFRELGIHLRETCQTADPQIQQAFLKSISTWFNGQYAIYSTHHNEKDANSSKAFDKSAALKRLSEQIQAKSMLTFGGNASYLPADTALLKVASIISQTEHENGKDTLVEMSESNQIPVHFNPLTEVAEKLKESQGVVAGIPPARVLFERNCHTSVPGARAHSIPHGFGVVPEKDQVRFISKQLDDKTKLKLEILKSKLKREDDLKEKKKFDNFMGIWAKNRREQKQQQTCQNEISLHYSQFGNQKHQKIALFPQKASASFSSPFFAVSGKADIVTHECDDKKRGKASRVGSQEELASEDDDRKRLDSMRFSEDEDDTRGYSYARNKTNRKKSLKIEDEELNEYLGTYSFINRQSKQDKLKSRETNMQFEGSEQYLNNSCFQGDEQVKVSPYSSHHQYNGSYEDILSQVPTQISGKQRSMFPSSEAIKTQSNSQFTSSFSSQMGGGQLQNYPTFDSFNGIHSRMSSSQQTRQANSRMESRGFFSSPKEGVSQPNKQKQLQQQQQQNHQPKSVCFPDEQRSKLSLLPDELAYNHLDFEKEIMQEMKRKKLESLMASKGKIVNLGQMTMQKKVGGRKGNASSSSSHPHLSRLSTAPMNGNSSSRTTFTRQITHKNIIHDQMDEIGKIHNVLSTKKVAINAADLRASLLTPLSLPSTHFKDKSTTTSRSIALPSAGSLLLSSITD